MRHQAFVKVSLALSLAAASFAASASHSWNGYHWARNTSSFNLTVIDSVTSTWQPMFNAMISQWSASSKLNLVSTQGSETSSTRSQCPSVTGSVRVCNYSYGNNGWLGLASINLDSRGHINVGTAKMNDSYSSSFTTNERYHVMCQEVGHTLGLGHTSEDGSTQNTCMDYSQSSTSTAPNSHDYNQLASTYQHLDSYNSYSSSFAAMAQEASTSQATSTSRAAMSQGIPMGFLVQRSRHLEVYAAPDGKGGLWLNHVFLAPGFENEDAED